MPPLREEAFVRGNIMIVDDNPANLKLLEDMLREHSYEVRSFPVGRLALAAADHEPPDLILLDVNMPEMNGYEVCRQLKANSRLAGIPVIFLTAMTATEDKVKGFQCGGIDYISKPFAFDEVWARLETHLALRRAQQTEHELLEKTLGGAVGILWELVQMISPLLALRSQSIRRIVQRITKHLEVQDAWQHELAARLCLLGCIALPDDVFERAYCRRNPSTEEEGMFRAHPENAARLLSKIPRLEVVAEIIRAQQDRGGWHSLPEPARQGAQILHLALELDRRLHRGIACDEALEGLRASGRFDAVMLAALRYYSPEAAEFEMRRLPLRDLRAGMVIEEDLFNKNGTLLILKAHTTLTDTWIERLGNFAKTEGAREWVDVRIPKIASVNPSSELGDGERQSREDK